MTYQEAIDYIHAHTWSQWKMGLERTRELLERLGNPQKTLRFVHVAGSNGKGSTCAMLERILREAGYTTGMYPSPYIEDFRERIQANGEWITEEALIRMTERVKEAADAMEDHPSQFELITAIGMLYFNECACDIVVLETGMGGTFDSTNVIDAPEVAVFTNIGLEHTEYLGDTIEAIATTKGGIIKSGSHVVCYDGDPAAVSVIRALAEKKGCPFVSTADLDLTPLERSFRGQRFVVRDTTGVFAGAGEERSYTLGLLGEYQLRNVKTVLCVVGALRDRGFAVSEEAVEQGLALATWPARFEVLSKDPLFILDGGHNPQCAEALAESVDLYLPDTKVTFLIGLLRDKDKEAILTALGPYAARFVCQTPHSDRALPAEELAAWLTEQGYEAEAVPTMEEAIETALGYGLPVIAFGSLYMAGEVRSTFRKVQ